MIKYVLSALLLILGVMAVSPVLYAQTTPTPTATSTPSPAKTPTPTISPTPTTTPAGAPKTGFGGM